MLEMVLKSDSKNEKALLRKCSAHIYLVEFDKANKIIRQLEEIVDKSENKASVLSEIKSLKSRMNKYSKSE